MSISEQVPDGTFVKEIAALVHPESTVHDIYRKQVLVVGKDICEYDDPSLPAPTPLKISTLSGVVDYVLAGIAKDHPPLVQVVSPDDVRVVAPLVPPMNQQFVYLIAKPMLPSVTFDRHLDMESFHIQLLSCFVPSEEREALQKFASQCRAGLGAEIKDDGVSQTVTVQSGVTRLADIEVKNPWCLAPFRSFPEIEQPTTAYLLRMKSTKTEGGGISASAMLKEADGGAWQACAIERIGAYLREKLPGVTVIA